MLTKKFWKRYFRTYDVLNLLIPYRTLLFTLCAELEIKNGDKILDAGCGTGNLASMINSKGGKIIGLDNCEEALAVYRKKDPTAKIVLSNLTNRLPFLDSSFNKIVCNNALYTIEKTKHYFVLKEFYRILKPGGKIILSNPLITGSPIKIYLEHVRASIKRNGVFKTIGDVIIMFIPTIKILFFNFRIKKTCRYSLFNHEEQKELLEQAGFIAISKTKLLYAEQNIFNSAIKSNQF